MLSLPKIRPLSIRSRLIIAFSSIVVLVITILSILNYYQYKYSSIKHAIEDGTILVQTIAHGSMDSMIRNDYSALEECVNSLIKKKDIAYIIIYDKQGNPMAQSFAAKDEIPESIIKDGLKNTQPIMVKKYRGDISRNDINDISTPVFVNEQRWGTVRVGMSLEYLDREIYQRLYTGIITGIVSIALCIITILVFMKFITKPMEIFIRGMKKVSEGDLSHEININTECEFKQMAESFNNMARVLKKSNEELEKTYKELMIKEKMAAIGEFSTRLIHEIKNPLTVIRGIAQLFQSNKTVSENNENSRIIIEEVDSLNSRIFKFLRYARPKDMRFELCNINEILQRTIRFCDGQKNNNVRILKKFKDDLPDTMLDSDEMKEVALNLILNSFQAMPEGGTLKISTSCDDHKWIKVVFEDSGIGIPPENIDKIFIPFFTTNKSGTGIGLTVVDEIIKRHQGSIHVTSKVGKGTRFEILLPIRTAI